MCGCDQRRRRLNDLRPGLGDTVATVAEPIKKAFMEIQNVIQNAVAAALGYLIADYLLNRGRSNKEAREKRVEADARTAKDTP